jgi:hypothetical protein
MIGVSMTGWLSRPDQRQRRYERKDERGFAAASGWRPRVLGRPAETHASRGDAALRWRGASTPGRADLGGRYTHAGAAGAGCRARVARRVYATRAARDAGGVSPLAWITGDRLAAARSADRRRPDVPRTPQHRSGSWSAKASPSPRATIVLIASYAYLYLWWDVAVKVLRRINRSRELGETRTNNPGSADFRTEGPNRSPWELGVGSWELTRLRHRRSGLRA